ncbi:MAG: hypothetical protein ACJ71R_22125 [Nitrososphaeraceae archaeon]
MIKTSLAIVSLVVVAAAIAIGFYAFAQDAQALSFSQSIDQESSVPALIIKRAGVGNQDASASFTCC